MVFWCSLLSIFFFKGIMGKDINIELKEQNVMLDAVEKDIDKEGEKMEDLLAG